MTQDPAPDAILPTDDTVFDQGVSSLPSRPLVDEE